MLTLQNGVDSARCRWPAPSARRASSAGTTYVATAIVAPGLIEQTGVHRRVILGEVFGERREVSERAARIAEVAGRADVQAEAVPDGRVPVWEKLVYLATFAAFTGAARKPGRRDLERPDRCARPSSRSPRRSRRWRAPKACRSPPTSSPRMIDYLDALPPDTRSSLLIDLQQGKPTEVEALQGEVVRRGRARGVPTPGMTALYAALRAATA